MTLMSAAQLAERLNGAFTGQTLRRWALEGRIKSAVRTPSGQVKFTEDAIDEILQPIVPTDGPRHDDSFGDEPLPGLGDGK